MTMLNTPLWTLAHLMIKFPAISVFAGMSYFGLSALENDKPLVAITFDDGKQSILEVALPYMEKQGIVGTTYLNIDSLNTYDYIDVIDIKTFTNANWEVGSHGFSHDDMTMLNHDELQRNLISSKQILEEISEQPVKSFASPYGYYNEKTLMEISNVYENHVNALNGWNNELGLNHKNDFDKLIIERVDITSDVISFDVCDNIRNLKKDDFYVILFHDIKNEEGKYKTRFDTFKNIVDCVKNSDVYDVTVSDGVKRLEKK